MNGKRVRVMMAEDQSLFAESLKSLLEIYTDDIEIVHIAVNGEEAVEAAARLKPDVILMDVKMPIMGGVEAVKKIIDSDASARIVMLSTFNEADYVNRALEFGAVGYLLKDITPTGLAASIRAVTEGVTQISPGIARKLVDRKFESISVESGKFKWFENLTLREREVFKLVAKGYDNQEIANELHIAYQTVRNYVSSIYSKLNVQDRFQIIKHAQKLLQ